MGIVNRAGQPGVAWSLAPRLPLPPRRIFQICNALRRRPTARNPACLPLRVRVAPAQARSSPAFASSDPRYPSRPPPMQGPCWATIRTCHPGTATVSRGHTPGAPLCLGDVPSDLLHDLTDQFAEMGRVQHRTCACPVGGIHARFPRWTRAGCLEVDGPPRLAFRQEQPAGPAGVSDRETTLTIPRYPPIGHSCCSLVLPRMVATNSEFPASRATVIHPASTAPTVPRVVGQNFLEQPERLRKAAAE